MNQLNLRENNDNKHSSKFAFLSGDRHIRERIWNGLCLILLFIETWPAVLRRFQIPTKRRSIP